jgi:ribose 5-phosphate isomerase B
MNEREIGDVVRRVLERLDLGDDYARAESSAVEREPAPAATPAKPEERGGSDSGGGTSAEVRATGPATWPPRRVAIGADHGGFAYKEDLRRFLEARHVAVDDCGTSSAESVDYPDFAAAVGRRVRDGSCDAGIVIDGMGIGSAIAANKIRGVRCAVCHDVASVLNSREHNDANVLSLGANAVPLVLARRMVRLWLETPCAGDRHLRRVKKIMELER